MEDISPLPANPTSGDDGLFLIFPQLPLQIKPLGLIFRRGASAGLKGRIPIRLSPSDGGCRGKWTPASLENANTHHPAGARKNVTRYCLSKQEHWNTSSQDIKPETKKQKKKTQQNQRSPSRSVLERQSTHEINYGCSLCKTLIEDHSDGATDEAFREQEFCSFKGVEVGLRIRRGLCSQLAHRGQRSGQVQPLTKSFKPSRPRADGGGRERDAVEC